MNQKINPIPAAIGAVFEGGLYAGIIRGAAGQPDAHLILLPETAKGVTWDQARAFAEESGGELPTRREQALLFANLPEAFDRAWYWSGEQHAALPSGAWSQNFYDGNQGRLHKSNQGRARAVRRLIIQ